MQKPRILPAHTLTVVVVILLICYLSIPPIAQANYWVNEGFNSPFFHTPVSVKFSETGEILTLADFKRSDGQIEYAFVTATGKVRKRFPNISHESAIRNIWIEPDGKFLIRKQVTYDDELLRYFGGYTRLDTNGNEEDSFVNYFGETQILGQTEDLNYIVQYRADDVSYIHKLRHDGSPDPDYSTYEYDPSTLWIEDSTVSPDGSVVLAIVTNAPFYYLVRLNQEGGVDEQFSSPNIEVDGKPFICATKEAIFIHGNGLKVNQIDKPAGAKIDLTGSVSQTYNPETQLEESGIYELHVLQKEIYAEDGTVFLIADKRLDELQPEPAGFIYSVTSDGNLEPVSNEDEWWNVWFQPAPNGDLFAWGSPVQADETSRNFESKWYTNKPIPYSSAFSENVSLSTDPVTLEVHTNPGENTTYQWLKDGTAIPDARTRILHFSQLQLKDAGDYQLEMDSGGTVVRTEPIILYTPEIPVFENSPTYTSAGIGERVTLISSVKGLPTPRVEWFRDEDRIQYTHGQTVFIPKIDESASGMYRAVATNSAGETVSQTFPLEVFGNFPSKLNLPELFEIDDDFNIGSNNLAPAGVGSFWQIPNNGNSLTHLNKDGTIKTNFKDLLNREDPYVTNYLHSPDGSMYLYWRALDDDDTLVSYIEKLNPQGELDPHFNRLKFNHQLVGNPFAPLGDGSFLINQAEGWVKYDNTGNLDPHFNQLEGTLRMEYSNDSKGKDGSFFMYREDPEALETFIERYNPDGTVDPNFIPPNRNEIGGAFVKSMWPDGHMLLMNSGRKAWIRKPNGIVEWELQLPETFPLVFTHPMPHSDERVYIIQEVDVPGVAQEVWWIEKDGSNNVDTPILIDEVGPPLDLTSIDSQTIVVGGTNLSDSGNSISSPKFVTFNLQTQETSSFTPINFRSLNHIDQITAGLENSLFIAGPFAKAGNTLRDRLVHMVGDVDYTVNVNFDPNESLETFEGEIEDLQSVDTGGILLKVNYPRTGLQGINGYNSIVHLNRLGQLVNSASSQNGFEITTFDMFSDGSLVYSLRENSNDSFSLHKTKPNGDTDDLFRPPIPNGRIYEVYTSASDTLFVSMDFGNDEEFTLNKVLELDSKGEVISTVSLDTDIELRNSYLSPESELWVVVSEGAINSLIKYDSDGTISEGFPYPLPFQFSFLDLSFFKDGTVFVQGNYDAFTLNPNGTANNTVSLGGLTNVHNILGLTENSILQKTETNPQEIVRLSHQPIPIITSQPKHTFVESGDSANFSLSTYGDYDFQFQWFKDGHKISGASSRTLNLTNLQSGDESKYSVEVTLENISIHSQEVKLSIVEFEGFPTKATPATIEAHPQGMIIRWKRDPLFNYFVETSIDLNSWQSNDREIHSDEEEAWALFQYDEFDPSIFVRLISERRSN